MVSSQATTQASPQLRGVIFDLDDTLVPEWQYVRSAYAAVGRHAYGDTPAAQAAFAWLWQRFLAGQHSGALDALSERAASTGNLVSFEVLLEVYRSHLPNLRLSPSAVQTLKRLRRKGLYLGVISDGPLITQQQKAKALGLYQYVDHLRLTDSWGRQDWKPSRRAFEEIEQLSGYSGTQLVYVGDNLSKDFVAPQALGWRTVQFKRPRQVHALLPAAPHGDPQQVVRSWRALNGLLSDWSRPSLITPVQR